MRDVTGLGALVFGVALAQEQVTVVVSASVGPEVEDVDAALSAQGLRASERVDGSVLARRIRLQAVTRRVADEDCGGTVDLTAWRTQTDQARQRFGMAQFEAALAELVSLELQAACLTSPPAASDLFRLELALAEAHRLLAEAEDGQEAFHVSQVEDALRRAAVVGAGLVAPADTSPELLAALDEARAEVKELASPRVLVAGPGARTGARFNGRPVSGGPFDAVVGPNLVQASVAGTVTAAAYVELTPGKPVLVWLAPGDSPVSSADLSRDVDALGVDGLDAEVSARLGAVAWLLETPTVFAGRDHGKVALWRAEEGALVPLAAPKATTTTKTVEAVRPWTWSVGAGTGAGFASIGDDVLVDVGGARVSVALFGRAALGERWQLALGLRGDGMWRAQTAAEGAGTLWHAVLPIRAGVRYGPRGDEWSPEVGLDLGLDYFGRFDDTDRASPVIAAAGGVARGLGPRAGLRLEGQLGVGLGYVSAGLWLGVEARR